MPGSPIDGAIMPTACRWRRPACRCVSERRSTSRRCHLGGRNAHDLRDAGGQPARRADRHEVGALAGMTTSPASFTASRARLRAWSSRWSDAPPNSFFFAMSLTLRPARCHSRLGWTMTSWETSTGSGSPTGGTQSRIDQAFTGNQKVAMKYSSINAVVCLNGLLDQLLLADHEATHACRTRPVPRLLSSPCGTLQAVSSSRPSCALQPQSHELRMGLRG